MIPAATLKHHGHSGGANRSVGTGGLLVLVRKRSAMAIPCC
jgi:hypothetical protein